MTYPFPMFSPLTDVPHRYWRVQFTANNGDPNTTSVVELEMYSDHFGVNVMTGGTITSSSNYTASYPATKANDGSYIEPGWYSGTGLHINSWLKYDFGAGNEKIINGIGIHNRGPTSEVDQTPKSFNVQYSDDDINWVTAWSVADQTGWSGYSFRRFSNPTGRPSYTGSPYGSHVYWRLHVATTEQGGAPSCGELEMRSTAGGSNLCTGGTPSASSIWSATYSADKAFDGTTTTLWSAAVANSWLQYQFASAVSVGIITIKARSDGFANTSPRNFLLQYADSSSGPWATAFRVVSETGWTVNQSRTFTDPAFV